MQRYVRALFVALLLFGLSVPAWGVLYDIQKELGLYGYLIQTDPSVMPAAIQNVACVPTATANSFVYLQNKYGIPLVPDVNLNGLDNWDIGAVASTLADANHMNTKVVNGGTFQDMAIYGKYKYLDEVAHGATTMSAMMSGTWGAGPRELPLDPPDNYPPIPKPSFVQDNTYPTWHFLWDNLTACEDVEICINEGDWGHCLTLTSFHWNDANNDSIIQQGEAATIDFIDPATGQWVPARSIYQGSDGHGGFNPFLTVNYGNFPMATLTMAMEESPEPGTIVLLLSGGIALLLVYRRWRRSV